MRERRYFIAGTGFEAPELAPGLHVVATPIGNLRDMTIRGLETLAAADVIYCEDTRRTLTLLNHIGIKKPLVSCYRENERQRAQEVVARVQAGERSLLWIATHRFTGWLDLQLWRLAP